MSMQRAVPLFLLLALIPMVVSGEGTLATTKPDAGAYGTVHVDLWNRYPGTQVTAHCRSKNTDFGIQGGATDIDIVSFSFAPSLWMNTLYYCTVTRSPGQGKIQFNIYFFPRDGDNGRYTSQCTWNVRPDGVHGVDQSTGKEDLFFPWGP